jgi:hypothetical protein
MGTSLPVQIYRRDGRTTYIDATRAEAMRYSTARLNPAGLDRGFDFDLPRFGGFLLGKGDG